MLRALGPATTPLRVWTAPRTWVTGEVVSAVVMNLHVRDNFLAIARDVTGVGRVFKTGSGTLTWNGAGFFSDQAAGGLTVTHGLGVTPTFVGVSLGTTSGVTNFATHQVRSIGATTFIVQAETAAGSQTPANGSTQAFVWFAIG